MRRAFARRVIQPPERLRHWISDTQLDEGAHRYRGNGAGVVGTLRTATLHLLRLTGFQSIRGGMQAVKDNITALLAMARRQPESVGS